MKIEIDEGTYTYTGEFWVDATSYKIPPETIRRKLEQKLIEKTDVGELTNFGYLVRRAKQCRQSKAYAEAFLMVERALEIRPEDAGALALKCSILRDQGKLEEALAVTERFRDSKYTWLLNTRAATLCDLERWDEAAEVVSRSLGIRSSQITLNLTARINSARPGLFARLKKRK